MTCLVRTIPLSWTSLSIPERQGSQPGNGRFRHWGKNQPAWRFPSTLIGAGEGVEVLMCKPFGYMVMCVPSFIPHLPSSELVVWYLPLSRGLLLTTLLSRITALSQGRNHCDRVWGNQHLCLVKLYSEDQQYSGQISIFESYL